MINEMLAKGVLNMLGGQEAAIKLVLDNLGNLDAGIMASLEAVTLEESYTTKGYLLVPVKKKDGTELVAVFACCVKEGEDNTAVMKRQGNPVALRKFLAEMIFPKEQKQLADGK